MYYVTMVRGNRVAWLAGPYSTHDEALEHVDEAKRRACERNCWHDFDAFGTARRETPIKTSFGVI